MPMPNRTRASERRLIGCCLAGHRLGGPWLAQVGLAVALTALLAPGAAAQAGEAIATQRVSLTAGSAVTDFQCKPRSRRAAPRPPEPDPLEPPGEEDVAALLQAQGPAGAPATGLSLLPPVGERLRVAVWGDSHMAAAFFTEELVRLAGLDLALARPSLLPATFGRAGVRLPLRRHCAEGDWRYESAHVASVDAATSGPGLVAMVASRPGAAIALDLRTVRGGEAGPLRLLYEADGAPLRVALALDGGEPTEVDLQARPGPAALAIAVDAPVSQLRLRLLTGTLRLQGLALAPASRALLQLDVFGYPGATAAGWARLPPEGLRPWLAADAYDLVVMAYGTNEGNASPFDAAAYRQGVAAAVANLRAAFPAARCVLIGPGDRGVLLRRSQKARAAATARRAGPSVPPAALLRYTQVHETIAAIQQQAAQAAGCAFWSPLEAMGGPGSAYRWAREGLMAADLIHFTVPGYQQLARAFAAAAGWSPASVLPARPPAR